METMIFSIIGLIIGGIITFFTSRYFFKKSLQHKELSTFIQFLTEILYDIDPDVEDKLKVFYENEIVKEFYQIQYVIANTGDLPIRDIIDPLKLTIPNKGKILDVSIVHVEPEGRFIGYKITNQNGNDTVNFNFPLLNSGEFFIFKILIKGSLPFPEKDSKDNSIEPSDYFSKYELYDKYIFSITADDLPPTLISEPLPPDYDPDNFSSSKDFTGLFIVALLWFSCSIPFYLLYLFNEIKPDLFLFNFELFFDDFTFTKVLVLTGWVFFTIILIFSLLALYLSFDDIKPQKEPLFRLPKNFNKGILKK